MSNGWKVNSIFIGSQAINDGAAFSLVQGVLKFLACILSKYYTSTRTGSIRRCCQSHVGPLSVGGTQNYCLRGQSVIFPGGLLICCGALVLNGLSTGLCYQLRSVMAFLKTFDDAFEK